jgi:23S rRNA pseudouridine2605 synthase
MDDDRKKFPRKTGPKTGAPRGGDGPRKGAKPGFGAKPRFEGGKPFEKRDGAAKPYAKRNDAASGAERPKRDFKRDDRPREGGDARPERSSAPFNKGPRPEGRPRFEGGKPFEKREGGGKPYAKRSDAAAGGERPKRDFKRDDRPREGGDARPERSSAPFNRGPRPEGKPYEKRDGDAPRPGRFERGDKPFRSGPRPEGSGAAGGERSARRFDKPQGGFEKRPRPEGFKRDGDRKPFDGERKSFDRPAFARPRETEEENTGERIAKRLARAGIASRRDAEELIAAGRVRVNGKVLSSPAFNVMQDDKIELDGTLIPPIERTRLFLFHKPAGVVTTNRDPEGRKTVFDILPTDLPRLMTVGRLDINTEGLLLLTNDGGLSRVLELPATGWLRRYRVRVHGKVEESALADLRDGIAVDGVFYGAIEASLDREQGSNAWLTIGLREGKNREVKNILGSLGLDVTRLIRISYGPFQLGELAEGHVWEMKGTTLREQLGERLIEESGANFEAGIVKPFSNKPTRRFEERPREEPQAERAPYAPRPLNIGEGGLIKGRKRTRETIRDDALGRLQTSPERGARPERGAKPERGPKPDRGFKSDRDGKPQRGGKRDEREQRPIEPPGGRKVNVWMAPGARPIGKGRAEADKARSDEKRNERSFGKGPERKPQDGKPRFDKPRGEGPRKDGPRKDGPRNEGRPSSPRRGKNDADRRR